MAQANVMALLKRGPLPPLAVSCSIPAAPTVPVVRSAAKRRAHFGMVRAKKTLTQSDARRSALMAAAQAGDRIAYETLLRDCVPLIAALARRQRVPPDRTDDVVQDVLLTVHRARATYDPRRSFEAWLRVIVERRAIDLMRQIYRYGAREVHAPLAYESHADEAIDLSADIERREKAERIGAALAQLPPRQREAVHHLMLQERSLGDAAALTGRSKGALKVNLHRALHALRLRMDRGD